MLAQAGRIACLRFACARPGGRGGAERYNRERAARAEGPRHAVQRMSQIDDLIGNMHCGSAAWAPP